MTSAPTIVDQPAPETAADEAEERPIQWFLGTVCLLLVVLIVIDRGRVLGTFGLRYTDDDQSILWLTAQDLNHFRFFAPYFYGQSYASWIEALVAVPLLAAGVAVRTAVPVAAAVVGAAPVMLLAAAAWRRRAPLTAVVVLSGFLLLTTDAIILSSMPRGLTGGIFVAAIGVVMILARGEPRPWAVAGFGLLAVLGASFNPTSLLLSGPAATYLLIRNWRSLEVGLWGGVGAGAGLILHTLAKSFYDHRPAYAFHSEWQFGLSGESLSRSLSHLDDYLTPYAVDFLRTPVVPLLAMAAAVALLAYRRRLAGTLAGLVAVVALVLTLATPKAQDGTASIFLPWFRFYLALPAVLAYLVVQAISDERVRPWVRRTVAAGLLVLAVGGFAWRQQRLPGEVAALTGGALAADPAPAAGAPSVPNGGARTAAVLERCRQTGELADGLDVELVVYTQDRLASYLCGAELYESIETMYPAYERRTWRLIDESVTPRTAMLVADVTPALCDRAQEMVSSCTFVSESLGLAVLRFPPQPVMDLVRKLGIEVRTFGVPVDAAEPRSS